MAERYLSQSPRMTSTPQLSRNVRSLRESFEGVSPIFPNQKPLRNVKSLIPIMQPQSATRQPGLIPNQEPSTRLPTAKLSLGVGNFNKLAKVETVTNTCYNSNKGVPPRKSSLLKKRCSNLPAIAENISSDKRHSAKDVYIFKSPERSATTPVVWNQPPQTKKHFTLKRKSNIGKASLKKTALHKADVAMDESLFDEDKGEENVLSPLDVSIPLKRRKTYVIKSKEINKSSVKCTSKLNLSSSKEVNEKSEIVANKSKGETKILNLSSSKEVNEKSRIVVANESKCETRKTLEVDKSNKFENEVTKKTNTRSRTRASSDIKETSNVKFPNETKDHDPEPGTSFNRKRQPPKEFWKNIPDEQCSKTTIKVPPSKPSLRKKDISTDESNFKELETVMGSGRPEKIESQEHKKQELETVMGSGRPEKIESQEHKKQELETVMGSGRPEKIESQEPKKQGGRTLTKRSRKVAQESNESNEKGEITVTKRSKRAKDESQEASQKGEITVTKRSKRAKDESQEGSQKGEEPVIKRARRLKTEPLQTNNTGEETVNKRANSKDTRQASVKKGEETVNKRANSKHTRQASVKKGEETVTKRANRSKEKQQSSVKKEETGTKRTNKSKVKQQASVNKEEVSVKKRGRRTTDESQESQKTEEVPIKKRGKNTMDESQETQKAVKEELPKRGRRVIEEIQDEKDVETCRKDSNQDGSSNESQPKSGVSRSEKSIVRDKKVLHPLGCFGLKKTTNSPKPGVTVDIHIHISNYVMTGHISLLPGVFIDNATTTTAYVILQGTAHVRICNKTRTIKAADELNTFYIPKCSDFMIKNEDSSILKMAFTKFKD